MGAADVESPLKERSMKIQMKKTKGGVWSILGILMKFGSLPLRGF